MQLNNIITLLAFTWILPPSTMVLLVMTSRDLVGDSVPCHGLGHWHPTITPTEAFYTEIRLDECPRTFVRGHVNCKALDPFLFLLNCSGRLFLVGHAGQ